MFPKLGQLIRPDLRRKIIEVKERGWRVEKENEKALGVQVLLSCSCRGKIKASLQSKM